MLQKAEYYFLDGNQESFDGTSLLGATDARLKKHWKWEEDQVRATELTVTVLEGADW